MFTIAEKGGSRLKATLDGILAGNFDEFLKKINENAKEFEQSEIERAGNKAPNRKSMTFSRKHLPARASQTASLRT